ncbi:CHAT domain-containing protein [Coleofasciculus sp. LEGE 07092]|nr:CHAT domain-containing protein [Coleofasciculus sp. LEGE 07081]MBE9151993.1 CHAT domain-containing protein [Coleofasciculus sp. LEGE 07092]
MNGNLTFSSANNITTNAIAATSITQTAGTGTTTFNGELQTDGTGGINLAGNNITVNNSITTTNSGQIRVNNTGTLTLGAGANLNLDGAFSQTGIGNVFLAGAIRTNNNDITFTSPVTLTGAVTLDTGDGDITFNNTLNGTQNIDLSAGTGDINFNGAVGNLNALGNFAITTANQVTAQADISSLSVNLTATDDISTRDITANSGISLTSSTAAVTTGNLNTSGRNSGGAIAISALERITTGFLDSSSSLGNGGNVSLDPLGDIEVAAINAQGGTNGRGGEIDITTERFFRATDTFTAQNGSLASISSIGGSGDGAICASQQCFTIAIRHGGGGIIPFDIGDATTNGTAGAITSGDFTIAPIQSFPFTYTEGNLQIISIDQPITPIDNPIEPSINPVIIQPPDESKISPVVREIPPVEIDTEIEELENNITDTYENYLGITDTPTKTLTDARTSLSQIEQETGVKPALIYVIFVPTTTPPPLPGNGIKSQSELTPKPPTDSGGISSTQELNPLTNPTAQATDQLELVLVTASGQPIRKKVEGATRQQVLKVVQEFRSTVTDRANLQGYQSSAKQLYQWLVAPLEDDLKVQQINNLVFIMDEGLRSLPVAALDDGTGFIIERYSVSLMPSLSLTDTRYVDVRNLKVLAMGASEFMNQSSLPAVPVELSVITNQLWQGKSFLNEAFTPENLKAVRDSTPFGIIHLATHGEFKPGKPSNSYIQFWDTKLGLNQLRQLGLSNPPVELMVLSACRSALGDQEAELGFTGLAVMAGVKSALGSLWYVNDEGTLGLITAFYQQLKDAPVKAEALRQAQLAMSRGEVRLENGQLVTPDGTIPLSSELGNLPDQKFSHPYYWSAFTLIGNPW